jgi:hypothetical protein
MCGEVATTHDHISERNQHRTIPVAPVGFGATLLQEPRNTGSMFHPRAGVYSAGE